MEGIQHLQTLDYMVLAGYFLVIVLAGAYFAKYIRHARDYFVAGSDIPWWLAAISLWMASFSSLSFVMYAEIGYKLGLTSLTLYWVGTPCLVAGAYIFVSRWRRARMMSPIGFIEARFSPRLRQVFVWTGFPLRLLDDAIKVYATSIFLVAAIPGEMFTLTRLIWITGAISVGFSFLGGQWAVIVTDFVQFVILLLAVCMIFVLSLKEVGGMGSFLDRMPEGFGSFLQPPYDWYQYLTWIVLVFFSYNAGWGMIQKYNCVRSENDARKVALGVAAWSFIGPIIFFLPAMFARVIMPEIDNPRFSYAYISLKVLPVGMMGVMIAAILSATLSTLSNEYAMLSSVFTNDFYAKKIYHGESQRHLIAVGRISMVIIALVTILIAVFLQYVQGMNLFDVMVKAFTAFAPAIMAPLLGGILFRRLNSRGALTGIVAGFISGSLLLVLNMVLLGVYRDRFMASSQLNYWLNQGWSSTSIIINFAVTIGGLWLGSVLGKTTEEEQRRTEEFFRRLAQPYELEATAKVKSPFPIIGIIVAIMGAGMTAVSFAVRHIYQNPSWFGIDLTASVILLSTGFIIWFVSREKQPAGEAEKIV
ncbi:MAG: sodium:solute symporter family transporter [Candidatus Latescibacterota bacterium]